MMGRWALLSAGLHTLLIVLGIVGLLDYKTDVLDIAQPLPVELVDHIEETSKSPDPLPESPDKEEPKEEPKPLEPPKPEPAPEPEPVVEEQKSEEIVPPLPEEKTPEKIVEKEPEPDAIEPPKAKPTPPKKPKKTPKKKPKPKVKNFDSILKNLMQDEPKKRKGRGGELSDRLAASELDRVRKQIEGVWRLPAGVKGMHEISIKVRISMNPDRTVRSVSLVNKSLLTNPTYQILAETALKAVNEFRYKPLLLPPNKYKVWKEITMEFDPRNIL